jgi:predicted nucleic acid-binding protein
MAQPLAAFQGTAIYLDVMILVGYLDALSPWHAAGRSLFQRALDPRRPIRLVTATLTIDELVFVLLQELVLRPPFAVARSQSQYLRDHPEVVRQLMAALDPPVVALLGLLALEPVVPADVAEMRSTMTASGMLPRDAIHLAVARRLGLMAIASDDDGFDGLPDVTLFKL